MINSVNASKMTRMQIKANAIFVRKNKIPIWREDWDSATTLSRCCAVVRGPRADRSRRQSHSDAQPGTHAERSVWEETQEGHSSCLQLHEGLSRERGIRLTPFCFIFVTVCKPRGQDLLKRCILTKLTQSDIQSSLIMSP